MAIVLVALGGCGSHGASQMPGSDAGTDDAASDDGPIGDGQPDGAEPEPEPGPWTVRGICSKDAWCWEHPLPQGNLLNDTWAAAANDVWAVGNAGTILHFDGTRWTPVASGTTANLTAIHGLGANDVWAVTDSGAIAHYDGTAWTIATTLEHASLDEVWALSATDVWAAGETDMPAPGAGSGAVYRFDGGSWTKLNTDFGPGVTSPVRGLWGSSANDMYFVTANTLDKMFHWDGHAFARIGLPTLGNVAHSANKVWGTASDDVWAVGNNQTTGIFWHFDGNGWTIAPSDGKMTVSQTVWGSSRTEVWAAGFLASHDYGTSHWDGTKWTVMTSNVAIPPPGKPSNGWSISASDVWLVGEPGMPWHWNGTAWDGDPVFDVEVHGLWAASPDNLWGVGHEGGIFAGPVILHGPSSWTKQPQMGEAFGAIWGAAPDDIWAVGDAVSRDPNVFRYNGQSWTPLTTTLPKAALASVWGAGARDVWVAGEYNLAHWNGSAWTNFATNLGAISHDIFRTVWGMSSADVWTYGGFQCFFPDTCVSQQDIRHWDGNKWSALSSKSITVNAFSGSGPRDVFAVGLVPEVSGTPTANKPRIEHWDGQAWTAMPLPLATKGPLHGVWAAGPKDVYAVGEAGTILHYNGAQWSLLESGTPLALYTVWGTDANHIFIGGKSGTILRRER